MGESLYEYIIELIENQFKLKTGIKYEELSTITI